MKTILVVCTANICRSPMAEAILRHQLEKLGLSAKVTVRSAGVWAKQGNEASENGVRVLARRGITLTGHRSQPASRDLLEQADIILVMEESHRRTLFHEAPQHLGKIFLLTEMARGHDDVDDPYGGPIKAYENTVTLLEDLITTGLPRILAKIGVEDARKTG